MMMMTGSKMDGFYHNNNKIEDTVITQEKIYLLVSKFNSNLQTPNQSIISVKVFGLISMFCQHHEFGAAL